MIDALPRDRQPAAPAAKVPRARPAWLADLVGVVVCCLAAGLALMPLASPGMPSTHDGLLHVQRLIALAQGGWLARWLPELAYGYGEPVFLYYAPLAYLPALVARLLGAGYVASVEASTGLALVLSGLTMYLLARSLGGPLAATVAGVVYAVLPYQVVDVYVRGALAESWAFVWLPLVAWCLLGARRDGRGRWSLGLALTMAGLVLTHNVTALIFAPALGLLGVLLWLVPLDAPRPSWRRPLLGLLAGLGLSAWFWLPALAERNLVQIGETLEPDLFASFFFRGGLPLRLDLAYDYREPASTALGSPIFWPQLGLVQAVVSVLGIAGVVRARGLIRVVAIWAVVLIVGGIVLQLSPAASLYDAVPLLAFVQFPWRLLALVGLGSAVLVAVLVERVDRRVAVRTIVACLVIGASLATALVRLQPDQTPVDERFLTRETILRAELADYGIGTTHSGEYLPITSSQRNAARFRKIILDDPSEPRTPPTPSSLTVRRLDWRGATIRADVEAAAPDRLVVHQFAFPGWVATIDGAPAEVKPTGPLGLLAVDVPTGLHTVELRWILTPLRLAVLGVSLLALVALPVLGGLRHRRLLVGTLGCAAVAAGLLLVNVVDGSAPALRSKFDDAQSPDSRLQLVDRQVDTSRLSRDRVVVADLAWLVREPSRSGFQLDATLVASDGATHKAAWPYQTLSRHWQRGEVVRTSVVWRLPPDFPGGSATLQIASPVEPGGSAVHIGQVDVPAPTSTATRPAAARGANVGEGLTVAAVGRPPSSARAGDTLGATLEWRATLTAPDLDREYLTLLALAGPDGDIGSEPSRPGDWFAPLPFWQAGDTVLQRVALTLPSALRPGSYPITAKIYDRELARGGLTAPGASTNRLRGRLVVQIPLGSVEVGP